MSSAMICPLLTLASAADAEAFCQTLLGRMNPLQSGADDTETTVSAILHAVKEKGLEAVVDYTRRFDAPAFESAQFRVAPESLAAAAKALPASDIAIITEAIENIRAFHEHQKERSWFTTREDGSIFGQVALPVDRAGLYIPGGKGGETPLVSSLIMNAVPAQTAKVRSIAVISPPMANGSINPVILATAHLLGLHEVYAAGSAWAIAALAFGAGPCAPVDVIAGPGNIFVATAKRLLIGTVGIDMIAGPSEVLVIADETASPDWIAADMLSQAEHDTLASAMCITTSASLAKATQAALAQQCASLPRKDIAEKSLAAYGAIMHVPHMDDALALANRIAPEHLELLVASPWDLLPRIRHAGAVFMGHYAAEPLGDYFAGPNHVLPTMGTARFASALGVETFMKKTSVLAPAPAFARHAADAVARLARLEGLEAHARSALCRKDEQ